MIRSFPRRSLSAILALALAVIVVPVSGAAAAPKAAPVMVVLDASGSMNATDVDGGTRIAAARHAADSLIDEVPGGSRMGLMVYGTSTGNAASDKKAGCRDIKTLANVGPVDSAALKHKVAGITASGYTPIGAALKKAAKELPSTGKRSVVLVSDGIDTCSPPDPCVVARALKKRGVDLTVHVVGFKVAGAARNQLKCVADATGGSYSDAHDAKSLTRTMHVETKRGFHGYTPEGTPISGGKSPAEAPTVKPGQYKDKLDKGASDMYADDGSKLYYRVHAEHGQRIDFAVTAIEPNSDSDDADPFRVEEKILDSNGQECTNDDSSYSGSARTNGNSSLPSTAVIQSYPVGSKKADCAQKSGDFIIEVDRNSSRYPHRSVPIELRVAIEPKADSSGLKPAYDKAQDAVRPASSGKTHAVNGGSSYNTARKVTPGTYSDTIVPGETKYYAIDLSFGQRLAYSVTSPSDTGHADATYLLYSQMATPMREPITNSTWNADFKSQAIGLLEQSPMQASMIAPVRYTNRTSTDDQIKQLYSDGTYYLAVKLKPYDKNPNKGHPFPIMFTIDAVGHTERGPRYVDTSEPTVKHAAAAKSTSQPGDVAWYREPAVAFGGIGALVLAALIAIGVPLVRRRGRN